MAISPAVADDDFSRPNRDQLFFASPAERAAKLELTLRNANELDYVLSGDEALGQPARQAAEPAPQPGRRHSRPGSKFRTGCYSAGRQYNSSLVSKNMLLIYLTNT